MKMSVGAALKAARERTGLRQVDIGRAIFASDKTVSAYEAGRRRIPKHLAPVITQKLDDPRLYLAAAAEATGGVLVGPWLDGDRVDLHRESVREKCIEEVTEALELLIKARWMINARSAADLTPEESAQVDEFLHQVAEAITALQIEFGVTCQTYSRSPAAIYQAHRQELATKGYLKLVKGGMKRSGHHHQGRAGSTGPALAAGGT